MHDGHNRPVPRRALASSSTISSARKPSNDFLYIFSSKRFFFTRFPLSLRNISIMLFRSYLERAIYITAACPSWIEKDWQEQRMESLICEDETKRRSSMRKGSANLIRANSHSLVRLQSKQISLIYLFIRSEESEGGKFGKRVAMESEIKKACHFHAS